MLSAAAGPAKNGPLNTDALGAWVRPGTRVRTVARDSVSRVDARRARPQSRKQHSGHSGSEATIQLEAIRVRPLGTLRPSEAVVYSDLVHDQAATPSLARFSSPCVEEAS